MQHLTPVHVFGSMDSAPDSHCTTQGISSKPDRSLYLKCVGICPDYSSASVRRSRTSSTGNLFFLCTPNKWARVGLAFADLIGGLCGVFRFPQNSFKLMPIFQTGCRMEYEIKRFTPKMFFQFFRLSKLLFPCNESIVQPETVKL